MGRGREWELDRVTTTCGYCGVGCQIEYAVKDGEIIYAQAPHQDTVNSEFLCSKGRYGWDFVNSPERLTSPMLRRDTAFALGLSDAPWELPETSPLNIRRPNIDEYFIPIDWETALEFTSNKLAEVVSSHGADAVVGLASARCSNEENYIFQKFLRAGIGTNNVDHCARL